MTNLNEKLNEQTKEMIELINDGMKFGCTLEEGLPATNYFIATIDGRDYQFKLELSIIK